MDSSSQSFITLSGPPSGPPSGNIDNHLFTLMNSPPPGVVPQPAAPPPTTVPFPAPTTEELAREGTNVEQLQRTIFFLRFQLQQAQNQAMAAQQQLALQSSMNQFGQPQLLGPGGVPPFAQQHQQQQQQQPVLIQQSTGQPQVVVLMNPQDQQQQNTLQHSGSSRTAGDPIIMTQMANGSTGFNSQSKASESSENSKLRGHSGGMAKSNKSANSPPTTSLPVTSENPAIFWITKLSSAKRDTQVEEAIPKLGIDLQHNMLDIILQTQQPEGGSDAKPKVFLSLCGNVRGNVVVHLLQELLNREKGNAQLGAACETYLSALVRHIQNYWPDIAYSQSSTIAFTRILAILPLEYQKPLCSFAIDQNPQSLARHEFGNFILKDVIAVAARNADDSDFGSVFEKLVAAFSPPAVFAPLSESRAGSHVVEALINAAPPHHVENLCRELFSTPQGLDTIVKLGWHPRGNYPLQAAFRALGKQKSPLHQCIADHIIPKLQGSNYRRNLLKAAGFEVLEGASQQPLVAPNSGPGSIGKPKWAVKPEDFN